MKRFLSFVLVAAAVACMEPTGPQATFPERLAVVGADALNGEPGFALAEPVRVRVLDTKGKGVAGEIVSFAVVQGGGSVSPTEATTDTSGVASAEWRLGPQPGANELRATFGGQSVTLRATATEGRGTNIARVSGGGNSDLLPAGCTVSDDLVVRVTDAGGNVVAGAHVGFEPQGSGGSATPSRALTDAK